MIAILLWGVYALVLFLVYGLISAKIINKIVGNKEAEIPSFWVLIWLGIIIITTLLSYFSIFYKIGAVVHLIVLFGAILYCYIDLKFVKKTINKYKEELFSINKFILLAFLILIFVMLLFSAQNANHYDTGFYHIQSVKWIKEYRVVPGLGNLHDRLAFNFSWFLTHALFDESFSFRILNSLIMLVFFGICFSGLNKIMKKDFSFLNLFKVSLLLPLIFLIQFIPSSSTDIPASLFIISIFILSIEFFGKEKSLVSSLIIILMSIFSITLKLSAFPILILGAYFSFYFIKHCDTGNKNLKKIIRNIFILAAITLFLLVPWFVRFIVLSGYLIFPFHYIDIFNYDWKIPKETVVSQELFIKSWARVPMKTMDNVLSMSFFRWFQKWVKEKIGFKIMKLLIVSILLLGIFVHNKKYHKTLKKFSILYIASFLGLLFWFLKWPDPRFGFGFIAPFSLLLIIPVLEVIKSKIKDKINKKRMCIAVIIYLLIFFISIIGEGVKLGKTEAVGPFEVKEFPEILNPTKTFLKNNNKISVYLAFQNICGDNKICPPKCWDLPLPCSHEVSPELELRGDSLQDGFRIVKAPEID